MELKTVKIADEPKIEVHGRTIASRDPVMLLWTGSYIEMTVRCSELYIDMEAPFETFENWILIEVNGRLMTRQMAPKERGWLCVFRNKMASKPTTVRIIKEVQAMNSDKLHCLKFYSVCLDGDILPVKPKKLKIEFIGDSITSGEGAIGAKEEEEWISMFFGHSNSYPYLVSKALDADYRVISQSGWGVRSSWDNDPNCSIPLHYKEICSVMPEETFKPLGFYEENNFKAWRPDVVVVNLATNDDGAFHNSPHFDPVTGEEFKQHMTGDVFSNGIFYPGTDYDPDDLYKLQRAIKDFLRTLRKCNVDAWIIWAYGMLGNAMEPVIRAGIADFIKVTDDEKILYLPLDPVSDKTVGARQHPGRPCHKQAAEKIAKYIQGLMPHVSINRNSRKKL